MPWQNIQDPYQIWLSEIMLQQTQVTTVIPYYQRFLKIFPTLSALANAPLEKVLEHWSGLGYYSRARNLHQAAQIIRDTHKGIFPKKLSDIHALPGIGRSTAAAISVFAFQHRAAILDGNVKRVFTRHFNIEGYPGNKVIENHLWELAQDLIPERDIKSYTQGLMDLGATLCTRIQPQCTLCPIKTTCLALKYKKVTQLPTPKLKKIIPEKHSTYLVLFHGKKILLEQRPPLGIWGGLWSLPELPADTEIKNFCWSKLHCQIDSVEALEKIKHGFSHFTLHIQPLLCKTRSPAFEINQQGKRWLNLENAGGAALPAPIKKLLLTLTSLVE